MQVTFITKTGHEIVEVLSNPGFDTKEAANLRALALGWTIKEIRE